MHLVFKIHVKPVLKCQKNIKKYSHIELTSYVFRKSIHEKSTFFVTYVKKTEFGAKIGLFTRHFVVFFTQIIKNIDFLQNDFVNHPRMSSYIRKILFHNFSPSRFFFLNTGCARVSKWISVILEPEQRLSVRLQRR